MTPGASHALQREANESRIAASGTCHLARRPCCTPTGEENGCTSSHSVVDVVTDDMPFLGVDRCKAGRLQR
ncbi:hypothetical protein [Streptomyces sp. NPDC046161]|uniref:hypothetical protein n=1 Tax=Streptomyces sp. NPDC046161 TaxID=3155132 RepID=UPI0033DB2D2A